MSCFSTDSIHSVIIRMKPVRFRHVIIVAYLILFFTLLLAAFAQAGIPSRIQYLKQVDVVPIPSQDGADCPGSAMTLLTVSQNASGGSGDGITLLLVGRCNIVSLYACQRYDSHKVSHTLLRQFSLPVQQPDSGQHQEVVKAIAAVPTATVQSTRRQVSFALVITDTRLHTVTVSITHDGTVDAEMVHSATAPAGLTLTGHHLVHKLNSSEDHRIPTSSLFLGCAKKGTFLVAPLTIAAPLVGARSESDDDASRRSILVGNFVQYQYGDSTDRRRLTSVQGTNRNNNNNNNSNSSEQPEERLYGFASSTCGKHIYIAREGAIDLYHVTEDQQPQQQQPRVGLTYNSSVSVLIKEIHSLILSPHDAGHLFVIPRDNTPIHAFGIDVHNGGRLVNLTHSKRKFAASAAFFARNYVPNTIKGYFSNRPAFLLYLADSSNTIYTMDPATLKREKWYHHFVPFQKYSISSVPNITKLFVSADGRLIYIIESDYDAAKGSMAVAVLQIRSIRTLFIAELIVLASLVVIILPVIVLCIASRSNRAKVKALSNFLKLQQRQRALVIARSGGGQSRPVAVDIQEDHDIAISCTSAATPASASSTSSTAIHPTVAGDGWGRANLRMSERTYLMSSGVSSPATAASAASSSTSTSTSAHFGEYYSANGITYYQQGDYC